MVPSVSSKARNQAVANQQSSQLRHEVDRLIQRDRLKDAVEQAKILYELEAASASHRLQERAYLLRARQLYQEGMPTAAAEVASCADGQEKAEIRVFQGEDEDTRYDTLVGEFLIEDLADVPAGNQLFVRLDSSVCGILKVTATERATGNAKRVTIDNAMERLCKRLPTNATDRLGVMFGDDETIPDDDDEDDSPAAPGMPGIAEEAILSPSLRKAVETANALLAKAERVLPRANAEDASELKAMLTDLRGAIHERSEEALRKITEEVEDLVFYLEDL
jgi:molecular chaperone DnaK